MSEQNFRIGIGYDIHRLVEGRALIVGGVKIPYEKGLLGHSDADVLVHAIIDALLGAMAMEDIGTLFPDTDDRFKDADSLLLLKKVYDKVQAQNCPQIPITKFKDTARIILIQILSLKLQR